MACVARGVQDGPRNYFSGMNSHRLDIADSPSPQLLLDGTRVVVFALNLPGPAAAARLRALGASIIKIEPPTGDPFEVLSPAWYHALHEGVQVRRLDLKNAAARLEMETLLSECDVFITAFRCASLERLSLDAQSMQRHPQLCHVSITGYSGSLGHVAGHDLTYQAAAGLLEPTFMPRALIADLGGVERAVSAAMTLLLARATGRGVLHAEVSLADVAVDFAKAHEMGGTTRDGLLGGSNPYYRIYPTRDGFIALAALEPQFQKTLLDSLQEEMLLEQSEEGNSDSLEASVAPTPRARHINIGVDLLQRAFLHKTAVEWQAWARVRDIPLAALANP